MKNNKRVEEIISLFFTTSRLIYKESEKDKDRPGFFSFLQLEVLGYIKENEKLSMKRIASFLSITPPSATSLINKLVKAGVLKRFFDEKDRRTVLLSLTPKGEVVLNREFKKVSAEMQKTLIKLNSKEQKNLIEIFQKLQEVYKNNE